MSRSYHKSNTLKYAFINIVCYTSNKISKQLCNRKFRAMSKNKLKNVLLNNNLENYSLPVKNREAIDNWDFASDGLKHCHVFKTYSRHVKFTKTEIKKLMKK